MDQENCWNEPEGTGDKNKPAAAKRTGSDRRDLLLRVC